MPNCAILTYHSQNISDQAAGHNDHLALREDLEAMHAAGLRFISLHGLMDILDGKRPANDLAASICLTFDDGCDFDVRDLDYPGAGMQRSFLGILEDFVAAHGPEAQSELHATSFVIASPEARRIIDARSLFGHGWISDDWWKSAAGSRLMDIGNHGWDHNHPDLDPGAEGAGGFVSIDTPEQCERQVIQAAEYIASVTGQSPAFFCYPFGESSAYIREHFFPEQLKTHRCRAALGTEPGVVSRVSDRWNLPRYVCGRDWQSPGELLEMLTAGQSSR